MSPLASLLAAMPDAERRAALGTLPQDELEALEYAWPVWARADQIAPARIRDGYPDWRTWLICSGRGFGKSRAAAEATRAEVESGRCRSVLLLSPTADTARRDQVAAILACSPPWCMPEYEASQRRLVYPNGAICHVVSCEEPNRIRGLNVDWMWWDELCASSNQEDVHSNAQLALRVPGPLGDPPSAVITTTPRRNSLLRAIIADPTTVVTRGSTFANRANLDAATLRFLEQKYGNTSLGRHELEGALWTRAMLDDARVTEAPELRRMVVAIDPAGSSSKKSDETGIVAVGIAATGHCYVLRDHSGRYSPEGWAKRAAALYDELRADCIVAESNFGGEMVQATLKACGSNARLKMVHASRGKAVRAEPVYAQYEQGRVHHVGMFPELEDQLCGWDPQEGGSSPDRLDALVWGVTELSGGRKPFIFSDADLAKITPVPGTIGWRRLHSPIPGRR